LKCNCGCNLKFTQKEFKQVIPEAEIFCDLECIRCYLKNYKGSKNSRFFKGGLKEPNACYDRVTKAYYRSWYEVYVARFLFYEGYDFRYEKYTLHLKNFYTPDFYIKDKDLFIEVKGRWVGGAKKKFRSFVNKYDILLFPAYLQNEFIKNFKLEKDVIK